VDAEALVTRWHAARAGDAPARERIAGLAREVAERELRARRVPQRDLEDLAQEAVRSTLAYLAGAGEAPREIRAFLKWRALGVLSDHRRRQRARAMEVQHDDPPEPAVEGPAPLAAALREQVRAALLDCRARLSADAREVLQLRYEGHLDAGAIALELGVTRNAVHVRTFRALAALRECLQRKGIEPGDLP
jgi:RNA polymerase sigma factor (sigma-70 family)